jgi:hypothetical protein
MECWSGFKEMAISLMMVRLGYGSWSRCFSSTGDLVTGEEGEWGEWMCLCVSKWASLVGVFMFR